MRVGAGARELALALVMVMEMVMEMVMAPVRPMVMAPALVSALALAQRPTKRVLTLWRALQRRAGTDSAREVRSPCEDYRPSVRPD